MQTVRIIYTCHNIDTVLTKSYDDIKCINIMSNNLHAIIDASSPVIYITLQGMSDGWNVFVNTDIHHDRRLIIKAKGSE